MQWFFAKMFVWLGWKVRGELPDEPKYIVAVAPHTDWRDFFIALFTRSYLKMEDTYYLGKAEIFRGPFGWFFRAMGGYPVDRSKSNKLVDAVIHTFSQHERFRMGIAPEGTRAKVDRLKTGFWYIAKGVGMPVVPMGFDFPSRTCHIGEPLWTSDDIEADMEKLIAWYGTIRGKNPELGIGA